MNTIEDARAVAERLSAEWPKRCGCGRVYVLKKEPRSRQMSSMWKHLPFAYHRKDEFGLFQARHCTCGSTLEILVKVFDLSKE